MGGRDGAARRGGYSRMAFLTRKGYDYFGTIDDVTDARANGPHAEGGQRRTKPPMSEPQTEAGNQIAL